MSINPGKGANTFKSLSPILKDVYPKTKKRKSKSKRFGRIEQLLDPKELKPGK